MKRNQTSYQNRNNISKKKESYCTTTTTTTIKQHFLTVEE